MARLVMVKGKQIHSLHIQDEVWIIPCTLAFTENPFFPGLAHALFHLVLTQTL